MRGHVEIFATDECTGREELVLSEDNLIVDGAGELLADIMTAPRSFSGMPTVSAVLDASNYTIKAFAMGKGKMGYMQNGHTPGAMSALVTDADAAVHGVRAIASGDQVQVGILTGSGVSAYTPEDPGVPEAPSPLHRRLEEGVTLTTYEEQQAGLTTLGTGHNINALPLFVLDNQYHQRC